MALAGSFATLIPAVLLYGLSVSFIDLGANTVGSAYEQAYKTGPFRPGRGHRHRRGLWLVHPQPAHHRATRPGHQPAAGARAARPDQPGHRGPGDQMAKFRIPLTCTTARTTRGAAVHHEVA